MLEPSMQPCLDEALRFIWKGMDLMPPGVVLIGGTAVALYFNHRASTDLDWADTTNTLNETSVYQLTSFDPVADIEDVNGGEGAVDCVLRPKYRGSRAIAMNFVEPDGRFLPMLTQPAIPASDNGVLVANPIDLARMKTMALFSRREIRDYLDVGTFAEREPEILMQAMELIRKSKTINDRPLMMALTSPPDNILAAIPPSTQSVLTEFAGKFFYRITDNDPKGHTR